MTIKAKTLSSYQISPRVAIAVGDVVRFTGSGPEWRDAGGEAHRLTLRGRWRVDCIIKRGSRVWLDVREWDPKAGAGASRVVFVAGRAYRRHGMMWRPYRVRRVRN